MSKQKATCCIYSCSDLERWTKSVSVFGKPQSHNLAFLGWILWYTSSDISLHAFTLCNCYCNFWSCKYWVIFNCLESGFIRKQVFYQSSRIVNPLFHICEKVRHTLKIFFFFFFDHFRTLQSKRVNIQEHKFISFVWFEYDYIFDKVIYCPYFLFIFGYFFSI